MKSVNLTLEDSDKIIEFLNVGKIGVIPTDTIYGIVGSALNPQTVEEIYRLMKRVKDKPFIILISSLKDLEKFDIFATTEQKEFLKENWPNPLSVVLPVTSEKFKYLHRGKKSLAFRMPNDQALLSLLKQTGPLVAPSANFEGKKPAETIGEAKKYFGDNVSFYLDGGKIISKPSTIIRLYEDGTYFILRKGIYNV